jgi:hypothetical protein
MRPLVVDLHVFLLLMRCSTLAVTLAVLSSISILSFVCSMHGQHSPSTARRYSVGVVYIDNTVEWWSPIVETSCPLVSGQGTSIGSK